LILNLYIFTLIFIIIEKKSRKLIFIIIIIIENNFSKQLMAIDRFIYKDESLIKIFNTSTYPVPVSLYMNTAQLFPSHLGAEILRENVEILPPCMHAYITIYQDHLSYSHLCIPECCSLFHSGSPWRWDVEKQCWDIISLDVAHYLFPGHLGAQILPPCRLHTYITIDREHLSCSWLCIPECYSWKNNGLCKKPINCIDKTMYCANETRDCTYDN